MAVSNLLRPFRVQSSAIIAVRRSSVSPAGRLARQRGFALMEVLVAMSILTVGLIGVGAALSVQSGVVSAIPSGQTAVTQGYYVTTAAALAQERLEQVKRITYSASGGDSYGAGPAPTGLPDENPVSGYPNFTRQVRFTNNSPAANMKTVTVTVTYTVNTGTGQLTGTVTLPTLIAQRQ